MHTLRLRLLVLPFAILPRSVSFVSWTVVSVALACATVRMAVRESAQQWPHRNVRLLVASTFLAAGAGATVRLGQLSWWLALPVLFWALNDNVPSETDVQSLKATVK